MVVHAWNSIITVDFCCLANTLLAYLFPIQVKTSNMLKPVREVYQEIVNSDEGGPRHAVMTPRDYKQVMLHFSSWFIIIMLNYWLV